MAFERTPILGEFRGKIAVGEPTIVGDFGAKLSAKSEQEGGIDPVVIDNSDRGSLGGLLDLKNTKKCHGLYGASSRERLPAEMAHTEETHAFKKKRGR